MDRSELNSIDITTEVIEEYTTYLLRLRSRLYRLRPFQRRHSTLLHISYSHSNDSDSNSMLDSFDSASFDSQSIGSSDEGLAFDYKSYPITLNWPLIDNDQLYHSIFSSRGAMGIILLQCLPKKFIEQKREENLLCPIVTAFIACLNDSSRESIDELINKLPRLDDFNSIISNKYYTNKEAVLLKLIIDFQCCYLKLYDGPLFGSLINWFRTAQCFYEQLDSEEIDLIRKEIVIPSCRLKKKIRKDIKGWLYKHKHSYLKAIHKEIELYQRHTGGLVHSDFHM